MKILYTSLIMMLVGCGVEEHKGIIATRDNYTQPIEAQVPDDTGLQESVVTQTPVVAQQPESASTVSTSSSTTAVTSTSTTASAVQTTSTVSVFIMKSIVDYGLILANGVAVTSDQLEQMKNNGRQVTLTRITTGLTSVAWQFNDGYIIILNETNQSIYVKAWVEARYNVN